ncbi:NADAR family protein, partial [Bacillus thuringiensis]|nr:NADAR family protein [Bacillus thuringiensis]
STALRKDSLQAVEQFDGEYRFLSNFWPCPIVWEGREAPTVEHHYNAAKTLNESERESVYACSTPGKAKRAGQRVTLRPGWDQEIKSQ